MQDELIPNLGPVTPLPVDIAKRYRHHDRTERIIGGAYIETGISVNQPGFAVYAKTMEGGIDGSAVLRMDEPNGEEFTWWLERQDIEAVVATLANNGYAVTYADKDYVAAGDSDITVSLRDEEGE